MVNLVKGLKLQTLINDNFMDSYDINPDANVSETGLDISKSTIFILP